MSKRSFPYAGSLPVLIAFVGLQALAVTDLSPQIETKHLMPRAVQVQITPRGMKYFDTRLNEILGNLGVTLKEGYFPEMSYTMDTPLRPEDYATSNPEAVRIYHQVRDLLTTWLVGFSLNEHRPTIEIGESGYIGQFSRFGLVTDEALMKSLGKRDGAILAIELEVKKITFGTSSVRAWDRNNPVLGKIGLDEVTVVAGAEEMPLKIRLPFYLRMNSDGGLEFEALELQNNLESIPLSLDYKKIVTPTFSVELNGKKYALNTQELDKLLLQQAPTILAKVREGLGDFMRTQLPSLLNSKAKELLSGQLEQVQDMAPPGRDASDPRPNFKWGLQLQNLNLQNSLNIDLTAYVEDPINGKSAPKANQASRGAPKINLIPQSDFDLALSVDRALINRVLQLSFERRHFEAIPQSDGSVLKLKSAPTIDYVKTPAGTRLQAQEAFVKLRVSIENQPGSIFLKNTITVAFDIIAKIRRMSDKPGMQLVLHSIDPDSMFLDDKYISLAGALFKGKVREGVKDELLKKSAGWSKGDEAIPGELPLPPELLGIKLDINRVVMDPNGHFVMYLDYAKTGAK